MHRETVTTQPAVNDYILSTTGFSWSVRRSKGDGGAYSISEGNRDRRTGLATLLALAKADRTDAWEAVGNGVFRRVEKFRPAAAQPDPIGTTSDSRR